MWRTSGRWKGVPRECENCGEPIWVSRSRTRYVWACLSCRKVPRQYGRSRFEATVYRLFQRHMRKVLARMKDPVQQLYDSMDEEGIEAARHHTAPPVRFRASEASNCLRAIYHRLRGHRPAPRKAHNLMYGVCGDVDHDLTRQLLNGHGAPVGGVTYINGVAKELMFYRKDIDVPTVAGPGTVTISVTARADGEIDTPRGPALLEIKGMGFYYYKFLNEAFQKGGHQAAMERLEEKHPGYIDQCMVTMALSGHKLAYLLVKDRATGTLGLHNPETGERTGLYIEFDEARYQSILGRFAYVQRKLDKGEPPRPEFTDGCNECSWCEYRYRCHDMLKRQEKGEEPFIVYPGPQVGTYDEPQS